MKQYIQKNSIKTLAALLIAAAGMTFTACSGDDSDSPGNTQPQPQPQQPQVYTMTVQATKGGDAQTRALADNGNTLTATWATTEHVYVQKGDTWVTGSLQPQSAGTTAKLFGNLSGVAFAAGDNVTLQFPKSGAISYTGQTGTLADIAENFDWATADVTIASVDNHGISVSGSVDFVSQQAIIKFTLQDKGNSNAAISPSALTVNDGTSDIVSLTDIPAATYTTNGGAGILYVALPAVSSKTITLTATVGSDTYTLTTAAAKSFTAGKFYRVTAQMAKDGLFTISNDNGTTTRQVHFSKGNLQATYDGSDWTWAFATNQWDYIGNAEGNTKVTASAPFVANYTGTSTTVDLFGWVGASSTWTGVAQYGINSSTTTSNTNGYGIGTNENLKSDWGTTMGTGWFTLTKNEWNYLFTGRTTGGTIGSTSQARYTMATIRTDVRGVNGIILFPDGVNFASKEFTKLGTVNGTSNFVTKCTAAQWTALETKGCVFLPIAGCRSGSSVLNVGLWGCYWSSSPITSDVKKAYYVRFNSDYLNPQYSYVTRNYGHSVRLVRVAN